MRFFTGLHQPSDAKHFDAAFVSVNRLRNRKSPFAVGDWIMDSGAFTEISTHGHYRHGVEEYAAQIRRWSKNGNLLAAVAQDWMCETFIVERTGLSVEEHQRRTVERYDALMAEDTAGVYVLPVLQGFPDDYTAIPYRGKPAADGPRYKALGNSWAVNCARWIGRRIEMVDAIKAQQEKAA